MSIASEASPSSSEWPHFIYGTAHFLWSLYASPGAACLWKWHGQSFFRLNTVRLGQLLHHYSHFDVQLTAKALCWLANIKSLALSATEHDEVAGDPLERLRQEVIREQCNLHKFFAKLLAATVNVDNIGRNAQLTELGTLLGALEYPNHQARTKKRFRIHGNHLEWSQWRCFGDARYRT